MNQSRRFRRPLALSVIALSTLVLAPACSGQAGPSNAGDGQATAASSLAPEDSVDAPEELAADNPFLRILAASLKDLNLRPDQQQRVQAIRTDLAAKTQPMREARHAVALTIAEGVAAGAIDDTKVQAGIERLAVEVGKAKPAFQQALNDLHATLDHAQRQALLQGMRTRGMALRDKVEQRGGPRSIVRARLGRLADELELDDAQRAAIRDRARGEFRGAADAFGPEQRRARMDRMREIGSAFATDTFDARSLDIGKEGPDATRKVAGALVRFAKVLVPELTPDQRAKLAGIIRTRADAAATPPTL